MNPRSDTNFDGMASAFEQEIYGSSKGYIRLNVLWEDLTSEIPRLKYEKLCVLDAGGGAGHIAVRLAKLGNRVVLCDPSEEMLSMTVKRVHDENLSNLISLAHSSVQNLGDTIADKFDVITCHAVLEWLADPKTTLGQLVRFLRPDGQLSLMFYNRNAALLKQIIRGDLAGAFRHREGVYAKEVNLPIPLDEQTIKGWLEQFGLKVISKAGIRIFHDHLNVNLTQEALEELLQVEKEMRKREPFASIGQHIHLVAE